MPDATAPATTHPIQGGATVAKGTNGETVALYLPDDVVRGIEAWAARTSEAIGGVPVSKSAAAAALLRTALRADGIDVGALPVASKAPRKPRKRAPAPKAKSKATRKPVKRPARRG